MKLINARIDDDGQGEPYGVVQVELTEAELRTVDYEVCCRVERGVSMSLALELVERHRELMTALEAINKLRR